MRAYSVHAPPGEAAPERFAFVKDGFSWPALFFPLPWMLWHRLWLALVWSIVFVLLLAWTERLANEDIAAILGLLGAILFAFEANNIRRLSLGARGWREVGGSFGVNREEAEMRFFERWAKNPAAAGIGRAPPPAQGEDDGRAYHDGPIFGLFPEPER